VVAPRLHSILHAAQQLLVNSLTELQCRRSFARFFIVFIIARHGVFDIFWLNFLFIRPRGGGYAVMAAKRGVHDYRVMLADTEMR